jgi:CheY-like chemotaxis protein
VGRASKITVSRYFDVRIADDALEAAFIEGSVRSAQKKRHRYGTAWSLFCCFSIGSKLFTSMHVVWEPRSSAFGWMVLLGYVGWLLTTCMTACVVYRAKSYTLEAYRVWIRWLSVCGFFLCLMVGCGLPVVLEQGALQPGDCHRQNHSASHLYSGWFLHVLNVTFAGFFCFGSSNRTQAATTITSWILGMTMAVVQVHDHALLSGDSFMYWSFILLHTSCCVGVLVAYQWICKAQRQGFLYTSMLVAQVQSEKDKTMSFELRKRAEARAKGEQAVCAWVCHEVRVLRQTCHFRFIVLILCSFPQIRNPLNALQFCIDEVIKDHDSVATHSGTMQQCNKHILSVITNMLDLSKLTEGKLRIKKQPFDLGACLSSVSMICKPLLRKGVEMRLDIRPNSLERIDGDPVLLRQLLVNLVCNAAQVVSKGFIEVVFEQVEDDLFIRISDTGPGLVASQIPFIFERYHQLGPGRSGGSGLGMVLAQQIAKASGAEITVKSPWQENGQPGTSMELVLYGCVLPNIPDAVVLCVEDAVDEFASVRDLKGILVVEDEPMNRMIMGAKLDAVKRLADCNANVVFVPSAEEGLALVAADLRRFGLLLVDEHLTNNGVQGMLGSVMIQAVRQKGYQGIVLSVSGNCMPADIAKYKRAGADLTWPKPYPSPNEMARSIGQCMEQREAQRLRRVAVL